MRYTRCMISLPLFFTGSRPRIERAYLDGSERKVIIEARLRWPNGITIDYSTETLYWVDAKQHVIESAQIDGSNRRVVSRQLCLSVSIYNSQGWCKSYRKCCGVIKMVTYLPLLNITNCSSILALSESYKLFPCISFVWGLKITKYLHLPTVTGS